ncbi:MAG: DNA mismatch repair protein MutS [Alphaproteobacteria bacterium]|nr:DNA mismatch repair protein MutS [Alphaproteobacteria bacterium]
MRHKDPDRPLTPDEKLLWDQLAGEAKPLKKRARVPEKKTKPAPKPKTPGESLPPPTAAMYRLPELSAGHYDGIDKRTQERFRKGEMPIDGRLDLHGDRTEEARARVIAFIQHHALAESRFLLIITGKGTFGGDAGDAPRGVLKAALPGWLAEDAVRPYILAFDTAKTRHGGSGAFYVLLRRRRNHE